jgi:hypothetical protein
MAKQRRQVSGETADKKPTKVKKVSKNGDAKTNAVAKGKSGSRGVAVPKKKVK